MATEGLNESRQVESGWRPSLISKPPLLVFHVNDSTDDQVLFQTACKRAQVPIQWHVAESAERGISYLDSLIAMNRKEPVRWPDLLILDLILPALSGLKVLEHVRKTPELQLLPVVVLTGHAGPELIEQALKSGANSCHVKPDEFAGWVELVRMLYTIWSTAKRPKI